MALKRAAFARKQEAVRRAVAVGDAIRRQRRRELLRAAWAAWHTRAGVSRLVQERFAACMRTSVQTCWARWLAHHRAQVGTAGTAGRKGCVGRSARFCRPNTSQLSRQSRAAWNRVPTLAPACLSIWLQVDKWLQVELAQAHCASAVQRRALAAWRAGVATAAEEAEHRAAAAGRMARGRALRAAWGVWQDWMDARLQRRERLAALLASLDGSDPAQLRPCFQRWRRAAQQARAQAARAEGLARRHQAAQLQAAFDAWSAYARAMRADPDPGSPFASPRAPEEDAQLIWDVAGLLAAAGDASSSGADASGSGASRGGGPSSSAQGSTGGGGEGGNARATASSVPAGAESAAAQRQASRRWRLKDVFKGRR